MDTLFMKTMTIRPMVDSKKNCFCYYALILWYLFPKHPVYLWVWCTKTKRRVPNIRKNKNVIATAE